ncbi:uncharacterized protein LOC131041404 isoform X2 [Cryptomeria japonica]|uniref:uncharacterized protein LOC131041404 isoform X2 n=1 Tax=Cryptomeria japonica TaxID=3369 RepID=UPI0027DA9586|nr:uncharacterized protein LOC131041404 isoform X2 [Cryptomeria japonica]
MKGQRSHRPSSTEPDDWVDGSWTVDCSCGVNYDDGEEMVNCDECGVWVHTKCSSFVKGETSFACDKCKLIKKRRNQETEETEVAQLLAELPTKTMRMDSCSAIAPPLRPDLPMDDRVHVQGLPTGDSSFKGLGIFSPQLWKCTGYVPKSLNFQYREFPCWDEEKENVDAQVDRPGLEVVVGLKAGIVEEPGSRDKSHHKHEQGMKGEKHQHHHGHHHRQGKRRKDDREHGGKKRVKSSGEKDKDEKLKRKSSSQEAGHGSRVLFRSLPNNPKAMRNLAAQKFLDDDIKLRSKVETHEPPCHEYVSGGTHEKIEGPDCEIEEAVHKCTNFDNCVIKTEECRETQIPDIEVNGTFKKNDAKKNVEKSKSVSAVRTHSTEMLGDSFICTVSSESQVKIDKKDSSGTGRVAKLSPWRESTNAQPEGSEFGGVIVKQEFQDVKTAVKDDLMYNAEKCNIDLRDFTHPAINAEQAIDVEFPSSKSISENYLQVDTLPNHTVTCPSLSGSAASASSTRLMKVQCEVKDESSMLDAKASSCSNAHSLRDKLLGKSSKLQVHNSDEPISCSQSKQLAASGNSVIKEATQYSGVVGRSSRPDDGLPSYKQLPLGKKQIEDLQASKDAEDLTGKSGQSKENMGNTDIKSEPDSAKQIVVEAANYSDDSASEERQSKLEQYSQGFSEQARVSPQQSSVLQQESRLPVNHRPRFTMGSSIYSASAIVLSMQVPSARSVAGSSKSGPVAAHLHKNTASGVGKTSNPSSVSRSPMSGPISVANSKSSDQVMKSSVNPVSSSPATKSAHLSKQRFRSGSPADFKKDEAGNAFGKYSNSGSPGRVPPDVLSFKPVVKENVKCSTNSAVKAASHGKASIQAGASKHAVSNSKGHKSFTSSKSSSGQNVPRSSSSAEQASATQSQNHLSMQTKQVTFGETHKNEKLNVQASQSVSKANTALPHSHPQVANSVSATLSDEEELNSSPRVPRVPRVRHTGNAPQLASPTPLSGTFVKRPTAVTPQCSSVSGQKDHALVSRRRGREDNAREGSRTPVQGLDESIKADGLLSSPDTRRLEENNRVDDFASSGRREVPSDNTNAAKKNLSLTNLNNMTDGSSHSLVFDSNDGPLSSVHVSPGDLSDDAENMITEGIALTLPGIIDDILSKAPEMSYEQICEAVLPHWQKLRKHNGERYAYTSHYQAVLDCLRNRTAWAHLVDRGPKTGMGRKRRRIDLAAAADSENEEDAEGRHFVHEEDQHMLRSSKSHDMGSERTDSLVSDRQKDVDTAPLEEVPKGKRKARRRRPVAYKGKEDMDEFKRSNKEDKQRYKVEGSVRISQEDEHEPFSPSSEDAESIDSEDDNHHAARNVRMRLASSDTSADDIESTPSNLVA